MTYLVTICVGIFAVNYFPALPSVTVYLVILAVITGFGWATHNLGWYARDTRSQIVSRYLICLALGIGWGVINAHQYLAHQLPETMDKHTFVVQGSVVGLVDKTDRRLRFALAVDSVAPADSPHADALDNTPAVKRLLLSWYLQKPGTNKVLDRQIESGDHWQLVVRLRRPRGMLNAGGFDYQAWLIQNDFSATGYIIESPFNQQLDGKQHSQLCALRDWVSRIRAQIREAIQQSSLTPLGKGIIIALTIGDKQGLGDWWDNLMQWGIVHLLVISGLHVGLVASFGFYGGLMITRIGLLITLLSKNSAAALRLLPPLLGLITAIIYSAMAGFSLPTQRATIAVAVVMLAKLAYRRLTVQAVFFWTLLLVAISQPMAVLSASFWLSFLAVAVLLLWFSPWVSIGRQWYRLLGAQLALFFGLGAMSLWFIGHTSWLGPVVNLIAVPWISLVVVPLCLLAMLIYLIAPDAAMGIWSLADGCIKALWFLLEKLPDNWGLLYLPVPIDGIALSCLLIAALGMMIPRGVSGRWLCWMPLVVILLVPSKKPPLRVTVLDVGQGLAVVIELPDRLLVYDTGPAYSEEFNAGSGIVAPFIRRSGQSTIDKLVISHEDNDHAGGFYGLVELIEVKQALLGPAFYHHYQDSVGNSQTLPRTAICEKSEAWSWSLPGSGSAGQEMVHFDILMPDMADWGAEIPSGNNYSCVLLIRWNKQQILLTGDIERSGERVLLERYQLDPMTLIVAPHHGSKTSSGQAFIDQLRPIHVVFSAGYRHQYGHPHPEVVQRYRNSGSTMWNTAVHGGVSFTWNHSGQLQVKTSRSLPSSYWWR